MRKDHRPYFIKKAYLNFQRFYVNRFLRPQLDRLGSGFTFMKPWYVELFGAPIIIGNHINVIASTDNRVRFSVWPEHEGCGRIVIGDYCLVCPGVRIGSAAAVVIGDNCMLASNAYVTDSDWHDIYNRITIGKTESVTINDNVWIGDSAIVCKGITIGENSIIGAGAVVTSDVPPNAIAAGNPARVIKHLNPEEQIVTRKRWFANPAMLSEQIDQLDRELLKSNTLLRWLKHVLFPSKGD